MKKKHAFEHDNSLEDPTEELLPLLVSLVKAQRACSCNENCWWHVHKVRDLLLRKTLVVFLLWGPSIDFKFHHVMDASCRSMDYKSVLMMN